MADILGASGQADVESKVTSPGVKTALEGMLTPVVDRVGTAEKAITNLLLEIQRDIPEALANKLQDAINQVNRALEDLSKIPSEIESWSQKILDEIRTLREGIQGDHTRAIEEAINRALERILEKIGEKKEVGGESGIMGLLNQVVEVVNGIATTVGSISQQVQEHINRLIDTLRPQMEQAPRLDQIIAQAIGNAIERVTEAKRDVTEGNVLGLLNRVADLATDIASTVGAISQQVEGQVRAAVETLRAGSGAQEAEQKAGEAIGQLMDQIGAALAPITSQIDSLMGILGDIQSIKDTVVDLLRSEDSAQEADKQTSDAVKNVESQLQGANAALLEAVESLRAIKASSVSTWEALSTKLAQVSSELGGVYAILNEMNSTLSGVMSELQWIRREL